MYLGGTFSSFQMQYYVLMVLNSFPCWSIAHYPKFLSTDTFKQTLPASKKMTFISMFDEFDEDLTFK